MAYPEGQQPVDEQFAGQEHIRVGSDRILRSILRRGEQLPESSGFTVFPAEGDLPIYRTGFAWANIGRASEPRNPLLLELRLEGIDLPVRAVNPDASEEIRDLNTYIALLMTNERTPRDLCAMGDRMLEEAAEREIDFDAIICAEQAGWKIGQAMATRMGADTIISSLQKGKPGKNSEISPPKPWIGMQDGIHVASGTSNQGVQQMLFLDPRIANVYRTLGLRVFYVDDARLTPGSGTMDRGLTLLHELGINVVGTGTVLNEANNTDHLLITNRVGEVEGKVPYISLTKLPLHQPTSDGFFTPIPGTFEGLQRFYVEE